MEDLEKAKAIIAQLNGMDIIKVKANLRAKGYLVETDDDFAAAYKLVYMGTQGCVSTIAILISIGVLIFVMTIMLSR